MTSAGVRLARPGNETKIETFLSRHADSSLFLCSSLAQGGLVDEGGPIQGTYAIGFDAGQVVGLAMHAWHGNMLLQAPQGGGALARMIAEATGRTLVALGGPWSQVVAVHAGLGAPTVQRRSSEDLFP